MKVAAGIDVGKAQLDVSVAAGAVRRFANSAAGITGPRALAGRRRCHSGGV